MVKDFNSIISPDRTSSAVNFSLKKYLKVVKNGQVVDKLLTKIMMPKKFPFSALKAALLYIYPVRLDNNISFTFSVALWLRVGFIILYNLGFMARIRHDLSLCFKYKCHGKFG